MIELFETFDDPVIIYERSVTIGVLSVYTWAVFQFTLVTTATLKDKNSGDEDIEQNGNALKPSKVFRNISEVCIHQYKRRFQSPT